MTAIPSCSVRGLGVPSASILFQISSIRGHSICHVARIKGRLEDVMQAFQSKQASLVDILVKDGAARIVVNR